MFCFEFFISNTILKVIVPEVVVKLFDADARSVILKGSKDLRLKECV